MKALKSRIAEPKNVLSRWEDVIRYETLMYESPDMDAGDFLDQLTKAAWARKPKVSQRYERHVRDIVYADSARICAYRIAIRRTIDELRAGKPTAEIIASLETVLENTKDGIDSLDTPKEV